MLHEDLIMVYTTLKELLEDRDAAAGAEAHDQPNVIETRGAANARRLLNNDTFWGRMFRKATQPCK